MNIKHLVAGLVVSLAASIALSGPASAAGTFTQESTKDPEVIAKTCNADVVIIGARGSGQANGGYNTRGVGFGPEVKAAADALTRTFKSSTKVKYVSVIYPAYNANVASFLGAGKAFPSAYKLSVDYGVKNLKTRLDQVVTKCTKAKVVLIGYSQGAEVVHRAVTDMEKSKATWKTELARIQGVQLIADPLNSGATTIHYTGGTKLATYTSVKAYKGGLYSSGTAAKAPSLLTSNKALSVCNPQDAVCRFRGAAYFKKDAHGVYKSSTWTSYPAKYMYASLYRAGVR